MAEQDKAMTDAELAADLGALVINHRVVGRNEAADLTAEAVRRLEAVAMMVPATDAMIADLRAQLSAVTGERDGWIKAVNELGGWTSLKECAEAWRELCDAANATYPGWIALADRGLDCMKKVVGRCGLAEAQRDAAIMERDEAGGRLKAATERLVRRVMFSNELPYGAASIAVEAEIDAALAPKGEVQPETASDGTWQPRKNVAIVDTENGPEWVGAKPAPARQEGEPGNPYNVTSKAATDTHSEVYGPGLLFYRPTDEAYGLATALNFAFKAGARSRDTAIDRLVEAFVAFEKRYGSAAVNADDPVRMACEAVRSDPIAGPRVRGEKHSPGPRLIKSMGGLLEKLEENRENNGA
jgi:hypothetical protein